MEEEKAKNKPAAAAKKPAEDDEEMDPAVRLPCAERASLIPAVEVL